MEDNKLKVIQKTSFMDTAKEVGISSALETVLPLVLPLIEPGRLKLEEYLSDGRIVILAKLNPNAGAKVIIFKTESNLVIEGAKVVSQNKQEGAFYMKSNQEDVIGVYDVNDFIKRFISGEFKMS